MSATSSWTRCNVTRDTSRFSSTNDGGGGVPSSNTLSRGAEGEQEEGSKGKLEELHDDASKAKIEEKKQAFKLSKTKYCEQENCNAHFCEGSEN